MKETLFRRAGSLLVGLCLLAGAGLATGLDLWNQISCILKIALVEFLL